MRTALFIGRFQPFHKGHLGVARRLGKRYRKVIIGIGSSQHKGTSENPFSYAERRRMIAAALKEAGLKDWSIAAIPDIGDHSRWVAWVESRSPRFDIVYTGNAFVASLFRKAGYPVRTVRETKGISATRIRSLMRGGGRWDGLVPPAVARFIKRKRLDLRISRTSGR